MAALTQTALDEEDERAPEEMLDPTGPLRQAQWDAAIITLREIDPQNPNPSYIANPGTLPSQAALGRLNPAVEAAAIKRVAEKVMPDGVPIGMPGSSPKIRELSGGFEAAERLFDYLRVGGVVSRSDSEYDGYSVTWRCLLHNISSYLPQHRSGS
jgi:hypothetical protein